MYEKTLTKAKVIGLWLDETDPPAWVVTRDLMNGEGEAEVSDTVKWWYLDDDNAYSQARKCAIGLGRKDGLCVIQTNQYMSQSCIYAPKIITVCDSTGYIIERVRLYGETLEDEPEWMTGCVVTENMSDSDIIWAVQEAWAKSHEDELIVSVENEGSIIE